MDFERESAINGKQLVVTFNKAVDKDTVIAPTGVAGPEVAGTLVDGVFEIAAHKKADGTTAANAVTADNATGSLSADGKTLTIESAGLNFDGNYTVSVNKGAKTTDGKDFPTFSTLINVSDTTGPKLVSASASAKTSTRTITVTFDEPVQQTGSVAYINGVPAQVGAGSSSNELVVTSSSDINAGSTVELSLLNVRDAAGNLPATNPLKTNVTVASNTAAPKVTAVAVKSENTVEVTFDKAMSLTGSSFAGNAVLFDSTTLTSTGINATAISADGKTVTFTAATGTIFANSNTYNATLVLKSDITDAVGNKLGTNYSQAVTFTKDVAAPQVTGLSYDKTAGKIVVTFNKNVTTSAALTAASQIIDNATGNNTPLTAAVTSVVNGNQLLITAPVATGNYSLRLEGGIVQDTTSTHNVNTATIQQLVVSATTTNDSVAPTFTGSPLTVAVGGYVSAVAAPAAEQTLTYTVTDATSGVDVSTLTNINNYTLDGKALPSGSYVTTNFNPATPTSAVTVVIHIPSDSVTTSTTTGQLVVTGVKDKSGNTAAPQISAATLTIAEAVKPVLSSVAIASGDNNTLVAAFSEAVTGVDVTGAPGNFTVTLNGTDVSSAATLSAITVGPDKGKYYLQVAEKYDAAGTGTAYIDLDGSNSLTTGDLTLATGVASAPTNVDFTSTAVTGLKVALTSAGTVKDAQGNAVTVGTEKVVK